MTFKYTAKTDYCFQTKPNSYIGPGEYMVTKVSS